MSVWSEAEMESTDRFWKWGWCLRYPSHVSRMACRSSWWCRADRTPTNTSCTAFWLSVNTISNRNDIISTNTEPNDITHAANHSNMQKAFCMIWRNVALHQCLSNGCSAVNGCRQNESPNIMKMFLTSICCFWLKYESIIHKTSSREKVFWSESGEKSARIKSKQL